MVKDLTPVQKNIAIPISALYPHSKNFREHPTEQIAMLKSSLERFGQVRSVVATPNDDGSYTIVAGHGVVEAAQKLIAANPEYAERFGKIRCDIIDASWPQEQILGYLAADNLISNHAQDDEAMLLELLQGQQNAGYDLASLGSDDETLRQMLESLGDEIIASGEGLMSISDESTAVEMIKTLKFGSYNIPLTDHEFTELEARLKDYSKEAGSYYGFVEGLLV